MTPITLTLAQVKENAVSYYNKGLLTAQHPDKDKRMCANFLVGGYRCAVSASYPVEFLEGTTVTYFEDGLRKGLIIVADPFEIGKIAKIQIAHDFWASAERMFPDAAATQFIKQTFLSLIGISFTPFAL